MRSTAEYVERLRGSEEYCRETIEIGDALIRDFRATIRDLHDRNSRLADAHASVRAERDGLAARVEKLAAELESWGGSMASTLAKALRAALRTALREVPHV